MERSTIQNRPTDRKLHTEEGNNKDTQKNKGTRKEAADIIKAVVAITREKKVMVTNRRATVKALGEVITNRRIRVQSTDKRKKLLRRKFLNNTRRKNRDILMRKNIILGGNQENSITHMIDRAELAEEEEITERKVMINIIWEMRRWFIKRRERWQKEKRK